MTQSEDSSAISSGNRGNGSLHELASSLRDSSRSHSHSGDFFLHSTPKNPITRLAVLCMDYRYAHEAERLQRHGNTIVFRNGGTIAEELLGEMNFTAMILNKIIQPWYKPEGEDERITLAIRPHRGCAVVNFVYDVFQGEKRASSQLYAGIIRHFADELKMRRLDKATVTREELEDINTEMKYRLLRPLAKIHNWTLEIPPEPRDLSQYNKSHDSPAVLIYTHPTNMFTTKQIIGMALGDKAEETRAYVVQTQSAFDHPIDFEIAHGAGIREMRLVSLDEDSNKFFERTARVMSIDHDYLTQHPFMRDMSVTSVPFTPKAVRRPLRA